MKKLNEKVKGILLTKKGILNKNYSNIDFYLKSLCELKKIRPNSWIGFSKASVNQGMFVARDIMELLGYSIISDNDGPRGGFVGGFLQLDSKRKISFDSKKFFAQLEEITK